VTLVAAMFPAMEKNRYIPQRMIAACTRSILKLSLFGIFSASLNPLTSRVHIPFSQRPFNSEKLPCLMLSLICSMRRSMKCKL